MCVCPVFKDATVCRGEYLLTIWLTNNIFELKCLFSLCVYMPSLKFFILFSVFFLCCFFFRISFRYYYFTVCIYKFSYLRLQVYIRVLHTYIQTNIIRPRSPLKTQFFSFSIKNCYIDSSCMCIKYIESDLILS